MQCSEIELNKLRKSIPLNGKDEITIENRIKFNILNFIHTIHLNNQEFTNSSYNTEFFGELPMTFKKKSGQVMGLITVKVKGEEHRYVFNDKGYEMLDELLEL